MSLRMRASFVVIVPAKSHCTARVNRDPGAGKNHEACLVIWSIVARRSEFFLRQAVETRRYGGIP